MNKFEYKEEYKYLISSMLNVTDDCNLACRYCFVEQHPHYMTLETAKAAVDWLYNNLQKQKELQNNNKLKARLYFFGGEPMLCYNSVIKPTVLYCKEKYPNAFIFGMTTNGTLLTEESINFFKEHNFSLLLSIDGNKETQDYNRPCRNKQSSFNLLEKNIFYLLKQFPDICFRSTGYAPTIQHLFENYLYAESLGFKYWITILDVRHPWTEEQKINLSNEIRKIYLYRFEQISKGIEPMHCERIDKFFNVIFKLLKDNNEDKFFTLENSNNIFRCGLATTNGAIAYDGSIYGCQEQPSKDNKNIFYIGNIFNGGIDIEKHYNLLNTFYESHSKILPKFDNKCENCYLNKFCLYNQAYDCPSTFYDLSGNMAQPPEIQCYKCQELFKNSILFLKMLEFLDKNIQEKFINNLLIRCEGKIK